MCFLLCIFIIFPIVLAGHPHSLVWYGGPLHLECENNNFLTHNGQYVRENVIVIKAVTFKDKIYVISPRWKRGVLATVWQVEKGRHGVELEPFPEQSAHTIADCRAIQNAIDFHLDHLGNLWVLDTGIMETMERPRCTCAPKIIMISISRRKIMKYIALTSLEPTSVLQNVVVEYGLGVKPYIYISDASRGAIIVHDSSSDAQWSVIICPPVGGLQIGLIKRGLSHTTMILVRLNLKGLLEIDTASLKRNAHSAITGRVIDKKVFDDTQASILIVLGEQSKPVILLGANNHHVYLRHVGCTDVLAWDSRASYNSTLLESIHSAGPGLTPTSVTADQKHMILILDSNYMDSMNRHVSTYHRISFVDLW